MKNLLLLLIFAFFNGLLFAQAPQLFQFQGLALDASGNPISNQSINLRISILNDSINSQAVYAELHNSLTNSQGVYQLLIGGGVAVNGTFGNIPWGLGSKFIKVEMDATGSSNYTVVGTNQLVSVPYALYAEHVNIANIPSLPPQFEFGIRFPEGKRVRFNRTSGASLIVHTFWLSGEEELLEFKFEGLPPEVTIHNGGKLDTIFTNIALEANLSTSGNFYFKGACQGPTGIFPMKVRIKSQQSNIEKVYDFDLEIGPSPYSSIPNIHIFNRRDFGSGSCSSDIGAWSFYQPDLAFTANQTQPGKATCVALLTTRRTIIGASLDSTDIFPFTIVFDIEFDQPGTGYCLEPIPFTIPFQTVNVTGAFGSVINPPPSTVTIEGQGDIHLSLSLPSSFKFAISSSNSTVMMNGVPCTYSFYLSDY